MASTKPEFVDFPLDDEGYRFVVNEYAIMALLSFAKQHLRMLLVVPVDTNHEGRWMPALIFDGYNQAQTNLMEIENFEGKTKMQNELAQFMIVRSLLEQSISGRLAVVLGDVTIKRVILAEEQIIDIENFHRKLFDILWHHPHPDYCNSPVWHKAVNEAFMILDLSPILLDPSCVDSLLTTEDSLAPLAPLTPLAPLAPLGDKALLALLGDKVVPSLAEQEFPNDKEQATHWEEDCDCTGDGDCDYSVCILCDCSDCNHVVDDEDSLTPLGDKVVPSLAEQEFPNDEEQATH
jgi:hypothetical protein